MNWLDEPKMKVWKDNITRSGCVMNSLEPMQFIHTSRNELLFALCKADITTPQGGKLPQIVLIRGNVVVIVPLVKNRDTGEERFITAVQYRIGIISFSIHAVKASGGYPLPAALTCPAHSERGFEQGSQPPEDTLRTP